MDWIFDHLQLIIVIAGSIAYWINQRAREKAGQEADYDEDGVPETTRRREAAGETVPRGGDPEEEERLRRIREEIQRKIAERRGQPSAPPAMPSAPSPARDFGERDEEPVFRPAPASPPPLLRRDEPPAPVVLTPADAFAQEASAALDRQRRLAEQMEELAERRRAAARAAERAGREAVPVGASAAASSRRPAVSLAAELRDPRALRRAFVMREVLDAPVALR